MKEKQIKSLVIAGFIGDGACFSGIAAMGFSREITAYAGEDVEINETNFPDTEFRKYVSVNVDKDGDGVLSETEKEKRMTDHKYLHKYLSDKKLPMIRCLCYNRSV